MSNVSKDYGFKFPIRVYYEDTDAGGVVFYANYLKFCERARTEWLRHLGVNQSALADQENVIFIVADTKLVYKKPAKLDDLLEIRTSIDNIGKASIVFNQDVYRDDTILTHSLITVCSVNRLNFRPCPIPESVRSLFLATQSKKD